jgi:hypothetical protein
MGRADASLATFFGVHTGLAMGSIAAWGMLYLINADGTQQVVRHHGGSKTLVHLRAGDPVAGRACVPSYGPAWVSAGQVADGQARKWRTCRAFAGRSSMAAWTTRKGDKPDPVSRVATAERRPQNARASGNRNAVA